MRESVFEYLLCVEKVDADGCTLLQMEFAEIELVTVNDEGVYRVLIPVKNAVIAQRIIKCFSDPPFSKLEYDLLISFKAFSRREIETLPDHVLDVIHHTQCGMTLNYTQFELGD